MEQSVKEKLTNMKLGEILDVVFSNGIAKSTKELERVEEDEWFVHSFSSGWETASLTLEEAIRFVEGTLSTLDLDWY